MEINIEGYVDAYNLGFITDINPGSIDCDAGRDCGDCPGTDLCKELSENGNYAKFKGNYEKFNIFNRLTKEIEDDC